MSYDPMGSPPGAADLIALLHQDLNGDRMDLLSEREQFARGVESGEVPDFLGETQALREDRAWSVSPATPDYSDRRVELEVAATEAALRAGMATSAQGCIARFADVPVSSGSLEETHEAVRAVLGEHGGSSTGPTLLARPRPLEATCRMPDAEGDLSASIVDVVLHVHGCADYVRGGGQLYLDLPGVEHHPEARWWNELLSQLEMRLELFPGVLRARVAVETLPAVFQMDEILWEVQNRSIGLAADLETYIAAATRLLAGQSEIPLPDRASASMKDPWAHAYLTRVVLAAHSRGTHAIGPRLPFTEVSSDDPSPRSSAAGDADWVAVSGFDGAVCADRALIEPITNGMDSILGGRPHQIRTIPPETPIGRDDLLAFATKPFTVGG